MSIPIPPFHHGPPPGTYQGIPGVQMGPGVKRDTPPNRPQFERMDFNPHPMPNIHQSGPLTEPRLGPNQKPLPKLDTKFDTNIPVNTKPTYEGFTFSKVETQYGEKQTWAKARRTSMPVTNGVLLAQVREQQQRGKSVLKQYNSLDVLKRAHIDRLIEEKNKADKDPRFEWKLASATTEERTISRTTFETTSMQVILKRILKPTVIQSSSANGKHTGLAGTISDLNAKKESKDKDLKDKPNNGMGIDSGFRAGGGSAAFMGPGPPHMVGPPHMGGPPQGGFLGGFPQGPHMAGPRGDGPAIGGMHNVAPGPPPPPPPPGGFAPHMPPPMAPFAPQPAFNNPFAGVPGLTHNGPPKSPKKSKHPKIKANTKSAKHVGKWLDGEPDLTSDTESDYSSSVFDDDDNATILTPESSRSSDGHGKHKKDRRRSHDSHHSHGKDHRDHHRESGPAPQYRQHTRRPAVHSAPVKERHSSPIRERYIPQRNDDPYEIRPARGPGLRRLSTTPAQYFNERPSHPRAAASYSNDYEYDDPRSVRSILSPLLPIRRGSIPYNSDGQRRLDEVPYNRDRDYNRDHGYNRERNRVVEQDSLLGRLDDLSFLDKVKEEKLDSIKRLDQIERDGAEKARLGRLDRERYDRWERERERERDRHLGRYGRDHLYS